MVAALAANRLTTQQIVTIIDRLDRILIDRESQPADHPIAEYPAPLANNHTSFADRST